MNQPPKTHLPVRDGIWRVSTKDDRYLCPDCEYTGPQAHWLLLREEDVAAEGGACRECNRKAGAS